MDEPFEPDREYELALHTGPILRGRVEMHGAWLVVANESGPFLVPVAQVLLAGAPGSVVGLLKRQRCAAGNKPRSPRPPAAENGGAWSEQDLRLLANAFLDGADDRSLAAEFSRPRTEIRRLHASFECARGNLVEDELAADAAPWVHRWRKVLAP